jgi:ribosomal protein S27E
MKSALTYLGLVAIPVGLAFAYRFLKKLRQKSTLVTKTPEGKMWNQINNGTCPNCKKKTEFYEGPHGGISINIKCASCGAKFNVTPMIGIAERI